MCIVTYTYNVYNDAPVQKHIVSAFVKQCKHNNKYGHTHFMGILWKSYENSA